MIRLVRVIDWDLCSGCRFRRVAAEPVTVGFTRCANGQCDNWATSPDAKDDPGHLCPEVYERLRKMVEERDVEPGSER